MATRKSAADRAKQIARLLKAAPGMKLATMANSTICSNSPRKAGLTLFLSIEDNVYIDVYFVNTEGLRSTPAANAHPIQHRARGLLDEPLDVIGGLDLSLDPQ